MCYYGLMSLFVFLFGLMVGSFLNCVIYRLEKEESFLKGRSYCPRCKHKLGLLDLIPVLSFMWLRGRCRYCHEKISVQYPLVEIATGLLFLLTYKLQPTTYNFIIVPFMVAIFVYDLKHYIIPDKVIYPAIAVALACSTLKVAPLTFNVEHAVEYALSAFGAAAFFLAIVLISRGKWMGVGDIKLAFLMGLILVYPNILVALFLAFLIGAIIGVGLMVFGKKTIKSEVPFGPFLVAGTFIALFFGKEIINWYVQSFYFN